MSQSLAKLVVHLIFGAKDRRPMIATDLQPELNKYIAAILRELDCPAIMVGSLPDHLHLLFNLHRSQSVSQVAEEVKKRSSKWIKTKGSNLQGFAWQKGYGVFSVSESRVAAVNAYIANQPEHHRQTPFMEELKNFLDKHHLEYDERYLWD